MCGIAGFIAPPNPAALDAMSLALRHRGPDASGRWSSPDGAVHLAHRRLVILDPTGGTQPMHSSDRRFTVVFNGEIYNHNTLRHLLETKGHRFLSDHSDTEVLLAGYAEWGTDLPRHLDGMWAFAIHDAREHSLFCSRDPFGKKPFYYHATPRRFLFASELTALLRHPDTPRSLSAVALTKFFAYGYLPTPHSMIEGVQKLPGGHSLIVHPGLEYRLQRDWQFQPEPDPTLSNPGHAAETLLDLLQKAVAKRLVADVPVGLFLSGGLDSSTITALAARLRPPQSIQTFSIGFDEPTFDESAHATAVATHLGTRHTNTLLSIDDARTLAPEVLAAIDEPLGDASILPTALLCRETVRHVKVALSGDGGDELLAGYDPFAALHLTRLYQRLVPRPLHPALLHLANHLPISHRNMSFDFKLKRTLRGAGLPASLWAPVWMAPLSLEDLSQWIGQPLDYESVYEEAITAWEAGSQLDDVARLSQFYSRLYLQDDILIKADRASMLHSLEVRSPFLDRDVAAFLARLPSSLKLRRGVRKFLLRKAVRPLLPPPILARPKKGFGVPIGKWFQNGSLQPVLPQVFQANAPFFNQRLAAHRAGRIDDRAFLWNCLALACWESHLSPSTVG